MSLQLFGNSASIARKMKGHDMISYQALFAHGCTLSLSLGGSLQTILGQKVSPTVAAITRESLAIELSFFHVSLSQMQHALWGL